MITPSLSVTSTGRVLPKLALNFTAASLDSRVTFARTTSASNPATYVDSNGYIVSATNDQPRFDYNPVTKSCKGLLVEESRTNLKSYSNDFSHSSWTKQRSSLTTDSTISPDGTANVTKIVEDTTSGYHGLFTTMSTLTKNAQYTLSAYIKKAERTSVTFLINALNANYGSVNFNLNNGTYSGLSLSGTASNGSALVEDFENGFYRCSFSINPSTAAGTSFDIAIRALSGSNDFYTGNGTSGFYIYGVQLESGASVTSYIPTTTTALTRNADVATITGANFSDWWVTTQGGVTANFRPSTVSGTRPIIQYDDGTANNIITLRGNTTNPELYIVDGGTPQAQIDAGTIVANTDYSLTGWWAVNDCKAKLGSGAIVTDTTATLPTVTQARIGSDGTNYLNGTIASINYYDRFSDKNYTRRKNKVIFSIM